MGMSKILDRRKVAGEKDNKKGYGVTTHHSRFSIAFAVWLYALFCVALWKVTEKLTSKTSC